MGKEAKAKEELRALGKFHVRIHIEYMDLTGEDVNVKSWNHVNNFLALDLYDGTMKVICLSQVRYFTLRNQDEKETSLIHS